MATSFRGQRAPVSRRTNTVVLSRHITAEIVKPMFLGILLLVVVFTGYSFAVKLSEAAAGIVDAAGRVGYAYNTPRMAHAFRTEEMGEAAVGI